MKGLDTRAGSRGLEKDGVFRFTREVNGNQMSPIPAAENSNAGLQRSMTCSSQTMCLKHSATWGNAGGQFLLPRHRDTVVKSQRNRYPLILFIYLNARGTPEWSIVGSVSRVNPITNFRSHPLEERKSERKTPASEQLSLLVKRTNKHPVRGSIGADSVREVSTAVVLKLLAL